MKSVTNTGLKILAVAGAALSLCSLAVAQRQKTPVCCDGKVAAAVQSAPEAAMADETKAASFAGPKANTGAVVMTKSKAGIKLSLTDDFKTPDTPDPHWQVVDKDGQSFLLQRIDVKDMKMNRTIVVPASITSVAKVQIWCAFAETNLGEAVFEMPKAAMDATSGMPGAAVETHQSGAFAGVKANKGFVTHALVDGLSVLTLSDDFVVPETPDPHWQVVDSKGRTWLLQRLPIKDGKVNRKITLPAYVEDVVTVQVWCAFAEVNLGEAKFAHAVK